jgi:hypothetical protein
MSSAPPPRTPATRGATEPLTRSRSSATCSHGRGAEVGLNPSAGEFLAGRWPSTIAPGALSEWLRRASWTTTRSGRPPTPDSQSRARCVCVTRREQGLGTPGTRNGVEVSARGTGALRRVRQRPVRADPRQQAAILLLRVHRLPHARAARLLQPLRAADGGHGRGGADRFRRAGALAGDARSGHRPGCTSGTASATSEWSSTCSRTCSRSGGAS